MQKRLTTLTESELCDLIEQELKSPAPRPTIALRLHQRLCTVRATRERLDLIQKLTRTV
jgi:hypothetical protein